MTSDNPAPENFKVIYPDVIDKAGSAIFNMPEDVTIVIPQTVIDRLSRMQTEGVPISKGADQVLRYLSHLQNNEGIAADLTKRIELDTGAKVMIGSLEGEDYNPRLDDPIDEVLIRLCNELQGKVTIISKNRATRQMYRSRGIRSEDFKYDLANPKIVYDWRVIVTPDILGAEYDRFKECVENPDESTVRLLEEILRETLFPNRFIAWPARGDRGMHYAQVRSVEDRLTLERFNISKYMKIGCCGIRPKNDEQAIMLKLLESCSSVVVHGTHGSGKTLIALAYAINQMQTAKDYKRIIVAKPIVHIGKEIGFLKGDKFEKLRREYAHIFDNLQELDIENCQFVPDMIYDAWGVMKKSPDARIFGNGWLELEALAFMRGRTINRMLTLFDEGQNATPEELKAVITRLGEGSKSIILGDIHQIDGHRTSRRYNGLVSMIQHYRGHPDFGYVNLSEGLRSSIATHAETWDI